MDCKTFMFRDDGLIPNNPRLPLLVYPEALSDEEREAANCRELLNNHGWSRPWINGIYSYHHYHSNTHEVLAVLEGAADVMMGGEHGEQLTFAAGDVVVIPAGVAHCRISSSRDFKVMGAYPGGKSYDLCTGKKEEHERAIKNIEQVKIPEKDPVTGKKDPLHRYWQ